MELEELGKAFISPDRPAGDDIRNDPDFEALQAEIEKLSRPIVDPRNRQAIPVDWNKVVAKASKILSEKSKDLLVAGYLALGLIHTEQKDGNPIQGLSMGLRIYRDLLGSFWESLYPPATRMKGRVAAIEWWEKVTAALKPFEGRPIPPTLRSSIEEDCDQVERLLRQHLEVPADRKPPGRFSDIKKFVQALPDLPEEEREQNGNEALPPPGNRQTVHDAKEPPGVIGRVGGPDRIEMEFQEAQSLARDGKLLEALERLQQGMQHSYSQRDKLYWKIALSKILLLSEKPKHALPYLDQIVKDIEGYKLEEWEPDLAITGFKVVWMGFNSMNDSEFSKKAKDILNRIGRLDLAEALRLGMD